MPWLDIIWTPENESHLLKNKVSRDEAEFVIRNPIAQEVSRTSKRPIIFGYTQAGRKLAVVIEKIDKVTVYPITAYDVE